jgi:hypothetical protein
MNEHGYTIIGTYGAEYRGFAEYYLLAGDVSRLNRLRWDAVRRATLVANPDRAARPRHPPRPDHHPHHPGAPRTRRPTIPARQPSLAHRTLHPLPDWHPTLRSRGTERDRPNPPNPAPPNASSPWSANTGAESLHWVRDTLYHEDNSTIHTRSGPRVMAALRNLAIGAIRLTGRRDITEATRSAGRDMHCPFKILKLNP